MITGYISGSIKISEDLEVHINDSKDSPIFIHFDINTDDNFKLHAIANANILKDIKINDDRKFVIAGEIKVISNDLKQKIRKNETYIDMYLQVKEIKDNIYNYPINIFKIDGHPCKNQRYDSVNDNYKLLKLATNKYIMAPNERHVKSYYIFCKIKKNIEANDIKEIIALGNIEQYKNKLVFKFIDDMFDIV